MAAAPERPPLGWKPGLRESYLFDRNVIAEIQRAAREGIYDIRGFGAKRRLPHFDDLLLLGASISRYPLEGYRERCGTDVVLGTRFAKKPLELKIPITIAGMSFGALSAPAKEALGRGATEMGTSTTTGDGGMTPEERESSKTLVYQLLPSRYGMNPDDLRRADAIEVVVGQGAKPGGGGMLLGHKISDRVAEMRDLPQGIDQRSASRHPDWTGPDDLEIKIVELREITDWEKPIFVKVGATRTYYDVQLAVKAGADVIVVDGMQGGTAATQDVFIEHVGIPTLPAVRLAVDALQELGMHRQVQLIVSGGIRSGADVAKALALGADAVSIGTAALIAMGDNSPELRRRPTASSAARPGSTTTGRPAATRPGSRPRTTSSPRRFDPVAGGRQARQLPARADARGADARPRLREVARPQPRAGGPRRADGRGGGDGAGTARRDELDPRRQRLVLKPSSAEIAAVCSSSSGSALRATARPKRGIGPCTATIAASSPRARPDRRGDRVQLRLALLVGLGPAGLADAGELGLERGRVGDRPLGVGGERRRRARGSPNASIALPAAVAWATDGRPSRVTPWT